MPEHADPPRANDPLDELVSQLLGCGAVLSQIISHMVQWEAAGRSAPEAAPIPVVAHELLASVLTEVKKRHSRRDLNVAAAILDEVTDAICEGIHLFSGDEAGTSAIDRHAGNSGE